MNATNISKSMQSVLRNGKFNFAINKNFKEVITNCKTVKRSYGEGTWISTEIINAYTMLHQQGFAYSAEALENGKLVGGLYGVLIGKVFFGESMFSTVSNASKFAFIKFIQYLKKQGIELIDCQVYTQHLESLGGKMISREVFMNELKRLIG